MKNLNQYVLESIKNYKVGNNGKSKQPTIFPERCYQKYQNATLSKDDINEIECADTSNVTNMGAMFLCANVKSVWDKRGKNIANKSLDLTSWDMSKVRDIHMMFWSSEFEQLDLSNWDTSNISKIDSTFGLCKKLKYLNISGWDDSNFYIDYDTYNSCKHNPFYGCYSLSTIIFGPNFGQNNRKDRHGHGEEAFRIDIKWCGANNNFNLSSDTWDSMLTMYDRKKARLDAMPIYLNNKHNIPDGWKDKIEAKGYKVCLFDK
jgi:hypothetical protein